MRAFQCGCARSSSSLWWQHQEKEFPPALNKPEKMLWPWLKKRVASRRVHLRLCALLRFQWWARTYVTDSSFLCAVRSCLHCRAVAQHRKLERRTLLLLCFVPVCFFFAMISGQKNKKVPGCVAMATPDEALLDCGSVSRSKPPCKQRMLAAC